MKTTGLSFPPPSRGSNGCRAAGLSRITFPGNAQLTGICGGVAVGHPATCREPSSGTAHIDSGIAWESTRWQYFFKTGSIDRMMRSVAAAADIASRRT